jgi:hypothetical protein
MQFYTETNERMTDVKVDLNGITHNIGLIEEGLPSIYMATGLNNETLRNGDTYLFFDFQKAVNAITEVYERSIRG